MITRILFILLLLNTTIANAASFTVDGSCDVFFSPKGGATDAIVNMINQSTRNINVLAYSFTSKPIADALILAKGRGVDVEIVLDKSQPNARGGQMHNVIAAGIPVWVDRKHAIAHNKVMVIDGNLIETESFNYTASAEKNNGENTLICHSVSGYNLYYQNWVLHQSHSVKQ